VCLPGSTTAAARAATNSSDTGVLPESGDRAAAVNGDRLIVLPAGVEDEGLEPEVLVKLADPTEVVGLADELARDAAKGR
jgi:hypothetical protein